MKNNPACIDMSGFLCYNRGMNNSKKKKTVFVLLRENKNMDIWIFDEKVSVVGVFDNEEQAKSAIWKDFDNLEHDERVDRHMVNAYWKDDNRLLFGRRVEYEFHWYVVEREINEVSKPNPH